MLMKVVVLAIAAFAALPCAAQAAADRIALVIGNSAYQKATILTNPVNDARGLAKALRSLSFDVQERPDLGHAAMKEAIGRFLKASSQARIALLFFAGHGMQVFGRNYLTPVDAHLASADTIDAEAMRVGTTRSCSG